jgi:5-oxoprolinase (ATP-hydrolysing) subunit B
VSVRLLAYGPRAVLAEYDSIETVMGVTDALRRVALPMVREVVPAARTVLVQHHGGDTTELFALLSDERRTVTAVGPEVRIPVRYDGADLAEVATLAGLSVDRVIDLHRGATYTVAFCGFMPGFAYLLGLPPELRVPRRSTPRPRVDTGSVAIAGEWASVYPSPSPGGWRLLGRTDVVMWDETSDRPGLLAPGTRVRFDAE